MKVSSISVRRSRALDQRAIDTYGIPVLVLMDHAGKAIAEATRALSPKRKLIFAISGGGNNGGDGVAAARWLRGWGYPVTVWWLKNPAEWKGSAALHYSIARKLGVRFQRFASLRPKARIRTLRKAAVLIDAVLGTGFHGHVRVATFDAITCMNASRRPIVAADVPSGLDADTGKATETAIKARVTVTMAVPKVGLLKARARRYVGRLVVADIGIPV